MSHLSVSTVGCDCRSRTDPGASFARFFVCRAWASERNGLLLFCLLGRSLVALFVVCRAGGRSGLPFFFLAATVSVARGRQSSRLPLLRSVCRQRRCRQSEGRREQRSESSPPLLPPSLCSSFFGCVLVYFVYRFDLGFAPIQPFFGLSNVRGELVGFETGWGKI